MPRFMCKFVKNGIGDPSSKYAFDRDGKQFEEDVQRHIDESEELYAEFVDWMKNKGVHPDKFRALFRRYYDEFVKEE